MTNPASPLIHTYYLILLDVAVGVCFLVILKVGMVWGMAKLAHVLRDDDPAAKSATPTVHKKVIPHMPPMARALWYGLSIAWMLSALIQINPQFLSRPHPSAGITGSFVPHVSHASTWFANSFAQHPMSWNVLSVMVQFSVGALLWTGRGRGWGRFVAWTGAFVSLFVWVTNGFGGTFHANLGFLGGWPGPGLLMAFSLVLLALPNLDEPRMAAFTRIGLVSFWLLAAVEEVLPSNGLWTPTGMRQAFQTNSAFAEPRFVTSAIDSVAGAFIAHPVVWNAVVVATLLLFAILTILRRPILITRVVASAFLIFTWWVSQNLGLNISFALSIDTAPIVALFVWMPHALKRPTKEKRHQRSASTEDLHGNRASV